VPQFRKKPVVIEAQQFDGSWESAKPILNWMGNDWPIDVSHPRWADKGGGVMYVPTLEGEHTASAGDWIIRGVKGEFYPCKDSIFRLTYEPVVGHES
jgi:hypothetical protein